MANTTTETIIGAAVLAVAVGFAAYLSGADSVSAPTGAHELRANFRSAEGVTVGTDVRLAGVKIGTVTDISLDRATYRAAVRFTVPADLELATDTQLLVSTEGLLGGTFLEVVPGGAPDNLAAGDEVTETQGAISVVTLLLKFAGGSGTPE
jgi:phospholipid/cholesterol/gamma-HCH transport system substrate-binding protein